MLDIGFELITLGILIYVFVATFEPLRSKMFKVPRSPRFFFWLRIIAILAALACIARIWIGSLRL